MNKEYYDFGAVLRWKLKATGTKQKDLADFLGTDEGYISRIVNGVHVPRIDTVSAIAKMFNCHIEFVPNEVSE